MKTKPKAKPKALAEAIEATPPNDLQAEIAVLGSILLKPSTIDDLATAGLRAEHFYDDAHRLLFDTLSMMREAGSKLDVVLIAAELKRLNRSEQCGGPGFLAKLADSVPNATHAAYYADIVTERWRQRTILEQAATVAVQAAERSSNESLAAIAEISQHVESASRIKVTTIAEACAEVAESLRSDQSDSLPTGIQKLDEATRGGLKPGQLTILAAATSVGKTAFALEIADNVAQAGGHVLYVSIEMSAREIVHERMLPRYSCTSRGTTEILAEIEALPIEIVDESTISIQEIAGLARIAKARGELDLLVIDHIGLLEASGKSAYERMTAISRGLMPLPKQLGVPVLALSQVNRESSKVNDRQTPKSSSTRVDEEIPRMKCPRLDQLRDSGSIEQDAHNVLILHRETRFSTTAKMVIAKQRNGRVGFFSMEFDLHHQRFYDEYAQRAGDFAGDFAGYAQ